MQVITVSEAKQLCIEAHEGQFRKPYTLNGDKYLSYGEEIQNLPYHDTDWYTLSDGCQIRLNGSQAYREPYSTHPIAVAEMVDTDEEKILAFLHDVVEDTEATLHVEQESLFSYIRFKNKVYYLPTELALDLFYLTKLPSTSTYMEYLKFLVTRIRAIKVKIADMFHNMSGNPSNKQKQKYLKGISFLLKYL